jgi:hypothetical protein
LRRKEEGGRIAAAAFKTPEKLLEAISENRSALSRNCS